VITIRPLLPGDDSATAEICRRTGFAGKDSRPHYRDDELLPDLYLRPLVEADPGLAFAAVDTGLDPGPAPGTDGGRPVGYLVATADTAGYAEWFRTVWLPRVAGRHPLPEQPSGSWDDVMTSVLHDPGGQVIPALAAFPAHLHMNVLPEYQRHGLGGRMMALLLERLRRRDVSGIHAAPSKYSIDARQFYKRMGFTPLPVPGHNIVRFVVREILSVNDPGPFPRAEDLASCQMNVT